MNIEQKENYTLISSEKSNFIDFLSFFEEKHVNLEKNHLIIQLSENLNITEDAFFVFLKYAEKHQQNGTSFAVIYNNIDVDKFPEWFNIVPTLVEAEDVLEMEAIQRDLGF